jgi:hypothetical protein
MGLSLMARMDDMRRFLEMLYAPVNLDCPCIQNAEGVHAFLKCIAEGCQMLKALFGADLDGDTGIYSATEDRITFEILELLLACPNLVYVTTHDSPPNTIK